MSACLCTGACMKPGGTCSAYPNGRPGGCSPPINPCLNYPNFCSCDCHKPWGSVIPPTCFCRCWKSGASDPIKPVINTLKLCKHGRPSKLTGCSKCYFEEEEKVEDKKENYATFEDYEYLLRERNLLMERIEKLESHKNYQVDENRKTYRHIELLEKNIERLEQSREAHTRNHTTIFERLDELESKTSQSNDQYYYSKFENLESRIKELEEKIGFIRDQYSYDWKTAREWIETIVSTQFSELASKDNKSYSKIPYRCPVCGGKGRLHPEKIEVGMTWDVKTNTQVCHACEGKGVLWG